MLPALACSIILMSVLARASGGGFFKVEGFAGRIPEILFAIPFGLCAAQATGLWSMFFYGFLSSYFAMETGHGTAFSMGRAPEGALSGRKQFLSPPIDALCRALGAPLGGRFYCYAFMGLKGLWLGLAAFPLGLSLAILWPVTYDLGRWLEAKKLPGNWEWGEVLSGAAAGLVVGLSLF